MRVVTETASIVAPEVITGVFLIALVAQISSIAAPEVITGVFLIAQECSFRSVPYCAGDRNSINSGT